MGLSSDEALAIIVPVVVYWACSGIYELVSSQMDNYRLHSRGDEDAKNSVSKLQVIKLVLLLQLGQSLIGFITFMVMREESTTVYKAEKKQPSVMVMAMQLLVGMVVIDTWQYFWHRYMHLNKFLYQHIHSWHHHLVIPYSFGALYTHPIEALLVDHIGVVLAYLVSGMTPRTSTLLMSLASIKTIDDHCGFCIPATNIFHGMFFLNSSAYHDIHHQPFGKRYNFSQPFFIAWDKLLGTYMPYKLEKRAEGGLRTQPINLF